MQQIQNSKSANIKTTPNKPLPTKLNKTQVTKSRQKHRNLVKLRAGTEKRGIKKRSLTLKFRTLYGSRAGFFWVVDRCKICNYWKPFGGLKLWLMDCCDCGFLGRNPATWVVLLSKHMAGLQYFQRKIEAMSGFPLFLFFFNIFYDDLLSHTYIKSNS